MKTNPGRFFEDYAIGDVITHAVPRTISGGERALYHALYPARHAMASSDAFARVSGLPEAPLDDLLVFHTVFGKTVPDISLNAVANLGYGDGRFHRPVYAGATITATSQVIGLREVGSGKAGIVWVRTTGRDSHGIVLEYVRWVLVKKRDPGSPAPEPVVPDLPKAVPANDLIVPKGLDFERYDFALAGEAHRLGDYAIGERIDHVDQITLSEAEHMMATRLWQNTAKVHFDATNREDGRRLIYGGHVISLGRALSFNGLANAQMIVALNGGTHANPCFAGDTVRAWSEVLDKAEVAPGIGAIRLRLVVTKSDSPPFALHDAQGKLSSDVFLELDYWALMPV